MITEAFLNSCISLVVNEKGNVKKDRALYRDILHVMEFYEKKQKIDIPVNIKAKYDCLKKICQLKMDDKSIANIIDSLSFTEKYKGLIDFLLFKSQEEISEAACQDNIRQVRLRKKLNSLFANYDTLSAFLESIEDGTFESIDDVVLDYENLIKKLFTNMMEDNRGIAIQSSSSLDLSKDDYSNVLDLIIKKYEKKNTTPTGYTLFDQEILNGGFEPSRIYIFGGGSGAGKSTILNNLIINSATKIDPFSTPENQDQKRVYLYITLENTIEESLLRTYQPLFNKDTVQVIKDINEGVDIKQKIVHEIDKTNSTIIMKYFPAKSISTLDIMSVLDEVNEEYGRGSIKGVYIDYLDLLKTDVSYDIYRLELGDITLALKTMAVEYNVPVITGTQLGRSVYRIQNSNELSLDQMSESIKKVEHADFVALLSKDPTNDSLVHMKVAKNRSGKGNVAMDFKVNFKIFKFISANKCSNSEKQNSVTENPGNFTGMSSVQF